MSLWLNFNLFSISSFVYDQGAFKKKKKLFLKLGSLHGLIPVFSLLSVFKMY